MRSKKGMELAIGTIVIIILSLLLLVSLIVMLVSSEKNFYDTVKSYFSDSNVDAIVVSCNNAVRTESFYEYCCVNKDVRLDRSDGFEMTCNLASNESWGGNIEKLECGINIC